MSKETGLVERMTTALENETVFKAVFFVAVGAIVGTIVLVNRVLDPEVSGGEKVTLVAAIAVLGLIFVVATLSVLSRRSENVKRWTYALAVMTAASLFSTLPLIVLDRDIQGWGLSVAVAWLLALLPGFLYLQFRTVRGRTLLEEFLHHLQRLKVDEYGTVPDAEDDTARAATSDDLYVRKFRGVFGAAFGASNAGDPPKDAKDRLRGDTLWPILWVTVLVAIGWSAVLAPNTVFGVRPFGTEVSLPNPEGAENALRFGFLGAYFYVIQMLLRRYFQKDLKPDAYVSAILRLVTVPLVIIVVHRLRFTDAAAASDTELVAAFVIGVFPEVGLEAIRAAVARVLGWLVPSLRADYPLSQIDGLNLFYQSRLLEEGIEDMQNLATADFVDLLLQTRIPIGRMVDWMDQAHLYIRLPAPETKLGQFQESPERKALRRYGVRCATDLEMAFGEGANGQIPAELTEEVPGLEFVLRTLRQEPNMAHVRAWKGRDARPGGGGPLAAAA